MFDRQGFCSAARWLLLFGSQVTAHMRLIEPMPLNGDMDANKNPLGPSNPFPCQGYIPSHPFKAAGQYAPGSQASITLAGTATHVGGSCQMSLSYDEGKTFRVIESIIGGCPLDKSIDFTIPSNAPSGEAILAWTWFNRIGNREMYMQCAWVSIGSSRSANRKRSHASSHDIIKLDPDGNPAHFPHGRGMNHRHHRRAITPFGKLPLIFEANIPQSEYVTDDGCDTIFPNPGPIVKQGKSLDSWCGNERTGYSLKAGAAGDDPDAAASSESSSNRATFFPTMSALATASAASTVTSMITATPFFPNTTTTTTSRTTTHTTTTRTTSSGSSTSSIAERPGSDACTSFGGWRCDQGGHRLERCNYAAGWVTSHMYAWANMGVPPGTRCVLDNQGQPFFEYDT